MARKRTKMHPGLYHQRAAKSADLRANRAFADDPATTPRFAHDANVATMRLLREIADLSAEIGETEAAVQAIQRIIESFRGSKHVSRLRDLAINELEAAQDRLHRALGVKVPLL